MRLAGGKSLILPYGGGASYHPAGIPFFFTGGMIFNLELIAP